jgi:hypothetical protein
MLILLRVTHLDAKISSGMEGGKEDIQESYLKEVVLV